MGAAIDKMRSLITDYEMPHLLNIASHNIRFALMKIIIVKTFTEGNCKQSIVSLFTLHCN